MDFTGFLAENMRQEKEKQNELKKAAETIKKPMLQKDSQSQPQGKQEQKDVPKKDSGSENLQGNKQSGGSSGNSSVPKQESNVVQKSDAKPVVNDKPVYSDTRQIKPEPGGTADIQETRSVPEIKRKPGRPRGVTSRKSSNKGDMVSVKIPRTLFDRIANEVPGSSVNLNQGQVVSAFCYARLGKPDELPMDDEVLTAADHMRSTLEATNGSIEQLRSDLNKQRRKVNELGNDMNQLVLAVCWLLYERGGFQNSVIDSPDDYHFNDAMVLRIRDVLKEVSDVQQNKDREVEARRRFKESAAARDVSRNRSDKNM